MKILADKTVIVAIVVQLLVFLLWTGISFAATPQKIAPTQQVAPIQQTAPLQPVAPVQQTKPALQQLPDTMFSLKPLKKEIIKIPGKVPIQPIVKADLFCAINTYHDPNRLREIANNLWHLNPTSYSPPLPTPWNIHWEIVVMNQGKQPAVNIPIRLIFSGDLFPPDTDFETETLAPGEAAVIKYYSGPFGPSSYYVGKQRNLAVTVDFPNAISEANESNNTCQKFVRFVYP